MTTNIGTAQVAEPEKNGHIVARKAADEALADLGTDGADYAQVFCSTKYDYEDVLAGMRDSLGEDTEIFGCSSSGEFTENGVEAGSVTVGLVASDHLKFFTSMATGLQEDPHRCVFEAVNGLPRDGDPELEGYPHRVAVNLHDGLSGLSDKVARITEHQLDDDVKLVGGAAGDDFLLEETNVFCSGDIASDAVGLTLVASEKPIPVTVNHGHKPISEPMTVTKSEGPVIHEIDGEPAFEAWKEAVRESAMENYGIDVDDLEDGSDELSFMFAYYEFGVEYDPALDDSRGLLDRFRSFIERTFTSKTDYNIRWAGMEPKTDGPLHCAVSIPEGTELRVMHSEPDDQIKSVETAAQNAVQKANGVDIAGGFVYDCFCRAAILEDDFEKALDAIEQQIDAPFAGFETYGEVCAEDDGLTQYHNSTSVVMLLPD